MQILLCSSSLKLVVLLVCQVGHRETQTKAEENKSMSIGITDLSYKVRFDETEDSDRKKLTRISNDQQGL